MKMPGTSLTAVAIPMSAPRGQRGRSTMQSKMQHAISGMPTWPKRRWSSTGESARDRGAATSTSAIGAARPKRRSERREADAHDGRERRRTVIAVQTRFGGRLGEPRERDREQRRERRVDERQRHAGAGRATYEPNTECPCTTAWPATR